VARSTRVARISRPEAGFRVEELADLLTKDFAA